VSDPAVNADQRFPLIAVVPVTGTPGEGALYPELSPGGSGLLKTSYALIDHLRSIDKRRIHRMFGRVTKDELAAVDQGLELFLGLELTLRS
jgi:mRNA-degrading endonuclease toxin of MazEF toxin-antitoxin module